MKFFCSLISALSFLVPASALAAAEVVYIFKVVDETAIVVRNNEQAYSIEKGIGCLSLWRYEGKTALITSPGLFLGIGSKLLLPDEGQECKIWNSEHLGSLDSLSAPSAQQSAGCEDGHWIQNVAGDGEIVILEDGSVWQVDSIDTITSSLWLPISNVMVCGATMINTDDGEKVGVIRLK